MKSRQLKHFLWILLSAGLLAFGPAVFAQGSIFGAVTNSDLSIPDSGEISFWGFVGGTDDEIRLVSSVGAGYDSGHWYDDFQNYQAATEGNPYDFYFVNLANGEGAHLGKLIPKNSYQQENIQLGPTAVPSTPTLVSVTTDVGGLQISWSVPDSLTCHIYRRDAASEGSFYRTDDPTGSLANPGIAGGEFIDSTADTSASYDYVLIADNGAGAYSIHSSVVTYDPAASGCCVNIRGNVNGGSDDSIDILDITFLVAYMFKEGPSPPCPDEGNVNGKESTNILDLVYLVQYSFQGGLAPPACP